MARVKCIMMQRDETRLLEPWLRHHGLLFGFENLVVLDHGSRDPGVLATLARHARAGVTVERHDGPRDFLDKGLHVARLIERLDAAGGYDFALPLDCDEFLAVFDETGLSCRRAAIDRAFDALLGETRALGIELSLANAIGHPGWFLADVMTKGFLAAGTVLDVDHGFHRPRSRLAEGMRWTPFCYLHFHNKPFAMLQEHARRKLDGLVDHRDPDALRAYQGINYHLVPYFFMSEAQYLAIPSRMLMLSVPEFAGLATALGTDSMLFGAPAPDEGGAIRVRPPGGTAATFDMRAYLDAHADVAASGMNPLRHYLRHGWHEDRKLAPPRSLTSLDP